VTNNKVQEQIGEINVRIQHLKDAMESYKQKHSPVVTVKDYKSVATQPQALRVDLFVLIIFLLTSLSATLSLMSSSRFLFITASDTSIHSFFNVWQLS
jgi:hypothetical protein